MPAILEGASLEAWLDSATSASSAAALLAPFNATDLEWHPCTKRMNQLKYNGEDCAVPISLGLPTPITRFFGATAKPPSSDGISGNKRIRGSTECAADSEHSPTFFAIETATRCSETACERCTFLNSPLLRECEMCQARLVPQTSRFKGHEEMGAGSSEMGFK